MVLHRPGAAFQPTIALKRAVLTTMALNTRQQSRRGNLGSKEAKSEDTKARHQSPVHPEAPSGRRHVGANVTRPR